MNKTSPSASDSSVAVTKLAASLHYASSKILQNTMDVRAHLSKGLFYDAALHWKADMDRLRKADDKGIRPAKHIAYLAFWIRKIKPITDAYPVEAIERSVAQNRPVPAEEEITDINERVAIRLAFDHLAGFAASGELLFHDETKGQDRRITFDKQKFQDAVKRYSHQKLGVDGKCVLDTLIHDMRYRAFGPHHLVHIFDQFVFNLSKEL